MAAGNQILLDEIVEKGSAEQILTHALRNGWHYHIENVIEVKQDYIICYNLRLLYFYHNRLSTYNFDVKVPWQDGIKMISKQKSTAS